MKFFIAIALIAAVASARVVTPAALISSELQEIIAAINSPSTDPATAAALEQLLLESMGVSAGPAIVGPSPISVGPAIVGPSPISVGPAIVGPSPISVGPAIIEAGAISIGPEMIDFPLPDGGAITAPIDVSPVAVTPVAVAPVATVPATPLTPAAPLVQIILNINQAAAEASPVAVSPVAVVPEAIVDDVLPVIVVDEAAEPINVVDFAPEQVIVPSPVIVAPEVIIPTPVTVVDQAPIAVEPVIIGTPIIPSPAINLPDTLN